METFGAMQTSTSPEEFYKVLGQLGGKSMDGAWQAGRLFNEGDIDSANTILSGRELLAKGTFTDEELKKINTYAKSIESDLGGLWRDDQARKQSMISGVRAYIAGKTPKGLDTSFGDNDLRRAKAIVTRQSNYNGGVIELPPMMDDDSFNRSIGLLTPDQLSQFGPMINITPEEVVERMRAGDYKLNSIGTGAYTIVNSTDQSVLATEDEKFVLHLDNEFLLLQEQLRDTFVSMENIVSP